MTPPEPESAFWEESLLFDKHLSMHRWIAPWRERRDGHAQRDFIPGYWGAELYAGFHVFGLNLQLNPIRPVVAR